MPRTWSRTALSAALVALLAIGQTEFAEALQTPQEPFPQAQAPAPSETGARSLLLNAHNVFIQNDGADTAFPADADAGYQRFVAAMQRWGRYNIVDDVQNADAVIQFRSTTTSTVLTDANDDSGTIVYTPHFHLTVADPAHLRPMWTMTVLVATGMVKGQDRFDLSVENAVSQVKILSETALTRLEQAAMRLPDQVRRGHAVLIWSVLGGMTAAAVGGGFLLHHEYQNSVNAMNQQSEQWCIANHFPVVDCELP